MTLTCVLVGLSSSSGSVIPLVMNSELPCHIRLRVCSTPVAPMTPATAVAVAPVTALVRFKPTSSPARGDAGGTCATTGNNVAIAPTTFRPVELPVSGFLYLIKPSISALSARNSAVTSQFDLSSAIRKRARNCTIPSVGLPCSSVGLGSNSSELLACKDCSTAVCISNSP